MIKYKIPTSWIKYDIIAIQNEFVGAKSAILTLKNIPYQRSWVDDLQKLQLKREIAGTSQIEGADFTDRELEEALKETPEQQLTRSQKQAHAAVKTYRWISSVPDDRPLNSSLIKEIHSKIVTGADDDHCEPGKLRRENQNVNFGQPRHRGAEGGKECKEAFEKFSKALQREFREHDPIIQALAAHYHFAAIHPFQDGNGRTARALEALIFQRAGLRDTSFIAMSNYYYDEKTTYLASLSESRSKNHNLTSFLKFGLKGIELQSNRLLNEIKIHMQKALFRNLMYDLFNRLKTKRKRVIADRQIEILKLLLENDIIEIIVVYKNLYHLYSNLQNPMYAFMRDVSGLDDLKTISIEKLHEDRHGFKLNLNWPEQITETDFMERVKSLPKAKTYKFLT